MFPVDKEVLDIVAKAFNDDAKNVEIIEVKPNDVGRGYSSVILFVHAKNKITGAQRRLVIKQTFPESNEVSSEISTSNFHNETLFYLTAYPALNDFQKAYKDIVGFNNIPECYGAIREPSKEKLIFEDLVSQGYKVYPPTRTYLDTQMYEVIFKVYGRFHGLSYAFKHYQKEIFFKIGKQFRNIFSLFIRQDKFINDLKNIFNQVIQYLKEENETDAIEKLIVHRDNCKNILSEALNDGGPNIVFVHGDSWGNNMLFKYNDQQKLEDIKLIDFQLSNIASPILDISYTFYTGASPETLDNLEHLHRVYYKSVTDTLQQYGCNPQEILTYQTFKVEWKKYVLYGLITSFIVWSIKCTENDKGAENIAEYFNESDIGNNKPLFNPNEEKFKEVMLNMVRHFHKNNFL